MIIAQLLTAGCGGFERKQQQIDASELARTDEVKEFKESERGWMRAGALLDERLLSSEANAADVVHVYGEPPQALLSGVRAPYVASVAPPPARWWRRTRLPALLLAGDDTPVEAVPRDYFAAPTLEPRSTSTETTKVVGCRPESPEARRLVELTIARIARFRTDVVWKLLPVTPTPEQLSRFDLWVDPAMNDAERNGCTAEAMVRQVPVVAARTTANERRLDGGRAGVLVKRNDPNELAHAVLNTLFKPETTRERHEIARQIAARFHPERRAAQLRAIYERAIG